MREKTSFNVVANLVTKVLVHVQFLAKNSAKRPPLVCSGVVANLVTKVTCTALGQKQRQKDLLYVGLLQIWLLSKELVVQLLDKNSVKMIFCRGCCKSGY